MRIESAQKLVEAVKGCLYNPGGDPTGDVLGPAAEIVEVLKDEGYFNLVSQDLLDTLRGNNIEKRNFLKGMGVADWVDEDE